MIGEEELLEYACISFQNEKYEAALEAFVLAYGKGYQTEWVLDNIYNCYMAGNEEVFRETYMRTTGNSGIPYEDCVLDFIPYKDGEYFIFDTEKRRFLGIFSAIGLEQIEQDERLKTVEFSGIAVIMDWKWEKRKMLLAAAKERKVYAVCWDLRRASSFGKIPELEMYWKGIKLFPDLCSFREYFHRNTAEYLPYIFYGNENEINAMGRIIEEEHLYRLTPEGRNDSNVLLTIGIPTHARGNLLLQRLAHLQTLPYDAEIEIAISKNGVSLYQEEYREASKISDARIRYYDHGKELQPVENWHYVVEMAHGKYVIFVSDEDDIEIGALEHYLKILVKYPDVNIIRPQTRCQYPVVEKIYAKKGTDAFYNSFLKQNYLSGLIVRRKDFIEENLLQLERYKENAFYRSYPHGWWCALLNLRGDYIEEPVLLISESMVVRDAEIEEYKELGLLKEDEGNAENTKLPIYATYEMRFRQFQGQLELIHFIAEKNAQLAEIGVKRAIGKLHYMIEIAREYGYKKDSFWETIDRYVALCMNAVDEFQFQGQQESELLVFIGQLAGCLVKLHEKLSAQEHGNI